jgi:hypothetical protein
MKNYSKTKQGGWDSPAYVAFIHPFCIIRPDDEEDFTVDLKDINENSYNHGLLCRIVASLSSPALNQASLLVCADGAIAVPAVPELQTLDDVLDILNGVMCCLLFGGQPCEAVDSRDIVHGNLHERRAIWPTDLGQSLNAHSHSTMRMKVASTIDTICLSNPTNVPVSEFFQRYETGRSILGHLSNVSPTLLLRGVTELQYLNLVDSLSNFWIVVEQLTELLWAREFLASPDNHPDPAIPNRKKALSQDSRTWSTSVRQEMLFQKGILPSATYTKLHPARKARNDLVHAGRRPAHGTVRDLFSAVLDLICIASGSDPIALRNMTIRDRDVFHPRKEYDLLEWNETTSQQAAALLRLTRGGPTEGEL